MSKISLQEGEGVESRHMSTRVFPSPSLPTALSFSSPSCLQSIKQHHKWAVQRTRRRSIYPLFPLETSLFHPPLLYIIRRLIRWLVIKLILRLVKLMHRYHRALIIHGTLSLAGGALILEHTHARVSARSRRPRIRGCEGLRYRGPQLRRALHARTPLFINIVT